MYNNNAGVVVQIPCLKEFNLPEGNFRGKLLSVQKKYKQKQKSVEKQIRFVFEVAVPSIKGKIPVAGRTFQETMSQDGDLYGFLAQWLGRGFFKERSGTAFDLERLVGMEADLHLIHFANEQYENPLVFISSAHPPGMLSLNENPDGWRIAA